MAEVRSLAETLEYTVDLDQVERALSRERVIRQVMAESGEPRNVVAEMADVMRSMGDEAVLGLTEGEPTTLWDALNRYVEELSKAGEPSHEIGGVLADLTALLVYPWPR